MMRDGVVSRLAVRFDEMRMHLGSLEGYFADGLGIDAAAQDELKAVFRARRCLVTEVTPAKRPLRAARLRR
jgi:hypothetical protein